MDVGVLGRDAVCDMFQMSAIMFSTATATAKIKVWRLHGHRLGHPLQGVAALGQGPLEQRRIDGDGGAGGHGSKVPAGVVGYDVGRLSIRGCWMEYFWVCMSGSELEPNYWFGVPSHETTLTEPIIPRCCGIHGRLPRVERHLRPAI